MAHAAHSANDNGLDPEASAGQSRRIVRRTLVGVLLLGGVVQVILTMYYLGAAHSPQPRSLPVGYVSTNAQSAEVKGQIEKGGSFDATRYADAAALTQAIKAKNVYGGADLSGQRPHLYVASAAGASAATALRTAFTGVVDQQRSEQVATIKESGKTITTDTLQQLTTPSAVTDVVPLPDADRAGTSLGLLVQVLSIGATIASMVLGRLRPHTTRSLRRGITHVAVLVAYALMSAAVVAFAASIFDVIPSGELWGVFASFALLSLALSASVAAAVALLGPGGAILGTLYFLIGIIISGSSIVPQFLPTWAQVLGQALPPGAGASLIRERLYFPEASVAGPATVLAAYAVVGVVVVMVTNAVRRQAGPAQKHLIGTD